MAAIYWKWKVKSWKWKVESWKLKMAVVYWKLRVEYLVEVDFNKTLVEVFIGFPPRGGTNGGDHYNQEWELN